MEHSEEQALAGLLPVRMGGTVHAVPTLKIKDSRKWREKVRAKLGFDPAKLDLSAPEALAALPVALDTDQLLELVLAFDIGHVMGTKAHIESTGTDEEVWTAAWDMLGATYPLVARGRSAVEAYGLEELIQLVRRFAPSSPASSRSTPSPNGVSTLTPSQIASPTSSS